MILSKVDKLLSKEDIKMKVENKIMKLKEEAKKLDQREITRLLDCYDYMCDSKPAYRRDVREILSKIPESEHDKYLYVAIYNYSLNTLRFL